MTILTTSSSSMSTTAGCSAHNDHSDLHIHSKRSSNSCSCKMKTFMIIVGLPLLSILWIWNYESSGILLSSSAKPLPTTDTAISSSIANVGASSSQRRKITLIARLRGQMGNILSYLVRAKCIQLWIEEHYKENDRMIDVEIIGQLTYKNPKIAEAIANTKLCFPNLRHSLSKIINNKTADQEFKQRRKQQQEWFNSDQLLSSTLSSSSSALFNNSRTIEKNAANMNHDQSSSANRKQWHHVDSLSCSNPMNNIDGDNQDNDGDDNTMKFCIHEVFTFINKLLDLQEMQQNQQQNRATVPLEPSNAVISLPFIVSTEQSSFDFLVDRYYEEIKSWLQFDEEACCKLKPHSDEIVFHYRNFRSEMNQKNYYEKGYEELNPYRVANEIFKNNDNMKSNNDESKERQRIAIASRWKATDNYHNDTVLPLVTELEKLGFIVRITEGHSSVEDFCFLKNTQRELVGMYKSTYTRWAALLGAGTVGAQIERGGKEKGASVSSAAKLHIHNGIQRIRLYSVVDQNNNNKNPFYHFLNSDLKSRIKYETYITSAGGIVNGTINE